MNPKPAATVVVVRDGESGLEVLMLQRTHSAVFMPGFFVFPGGAVEHADQEPVDRRHAGAADAANRMLGVDQGGLAFLSAAIRECFEEAGLLLADKRSPGEVCSDDELVAWRRRLAADELGFAQLCEALDLRPQFDRLAYLSRWITPPGLPRRYDTRFFVASAPAGQHASHDGEETIDHVWITPREALAGHQRGEFPLVAPTIRTLHVLAGFDDSQQVLDYARRQPVPRAGGALAASGRDGTRLLRPGDPAYHEAAKLDREGLGQASYELIPGVVQALSQRVRRVTAPNPGMMTGPGTNTYLVGDGDELAVIDPGPELHQHLDAIMAVAGDSIRWILATHTHADHSPGARELKRRTGATVLGMPPPAGDSQDASFAPDRILVHGERLHFGDATIKVIHTPGHASNHLCYLLEQEKLLFSGDHIMQGSTVVISPPDGDMRAYLDALDALHGEDIAYIAPGHGFLIGEPHAAIDRISSHRRLRETKVLDAVNTLAPASETELLARVYEDVPDALHRVAVRSLRAHLIKLRDDGVIHERDALWHPAG